MVASRTSSFNRLLFRAAVLPLLLLIVLAVVLVTQIQHLLTSAAWVEHTDLVITDTSRLLRRYIDMETGLRGYMMTADTVFLEPFNSGLSDSFGITQAIRDRVVDNAGQEAAIDEIDRLGKEWIAYAQGETRARPAGPETTERAKDGKRMMDNLRDHFTRFLGVEERLRDERGKFAREAATHSVWIACGTAVAVGVVLAFLARRQFGELARTYESALATANALTADLEQRVAERTKELAHVNESLVEVNREMEAFGYSISHDLRAPLRHISGFADLLKMSMSKDLAPDDAENLTTIGDTAKLAGRMVDDLLAFSRIGRTEPRRDPVDMDEVVDRCRRELEPETRHREIEWVVTPLPVARGDPALLKMVVSNLLSNAIKYTSKNEKSRIEISGTNGDDHVATYHVTDNGVGFDMAYANKLFGVFQRLHRAEEYEGTGIGLANVRRIIVRHGGRVWADAKLGQGATFSFTLPTGVKANA